METNNIDLVKIVASDGHVLTEVEEVENRTFCSVVYTTTSSKDKWKEITQAEAVALQAGKTTAEIAADGNTLEGAIQKKIAEINDYSESNAVNSLTYNGVETWLTPAIRSNYLTSISSAELLGETSITFAIAGQAVTVPLQNAKILLAKIQRYADASYLVTQKHIAEVSKLTTVAEVEAYDITQGYPEKLSF
jgi:hypothetical protein